MDLGTVLVSAAIAVLLFFAVRHLMKHGACSGCSGAGKSGSGCCGCPHAGSCRSKSV